MQKTEILTTDFLKQIGTVDDIQAEAKKGSGLSEPVPFNTHIHLPPNFSAFETVQQAVDLAAEQGVQVLGAGNYYNFSVYREFAKATGQKNIFPMFGTEIIALEKDLQQEGVRINDPGNPGKYYICGKGISDFEKLSDRASQLLSLIRRNDTQRMKEMTAKMAKVFSEHSIDTGMDDLAVIARIVKRHGCSAEMVTLQERHLAQVFQEVFFEKIPATQRLQKLTDLFGAIPKSSPYDAVGIQNEIRSYLMKAGKSCFVPETFVNLAQAKELILELGGVPCYPVLADGSKQRCEYETPLEKLIETLKTNHYTMVEFIPIRNQPDVLAEYVKAIRRAGIVVVAGTEHNTLDLLPIEPTCADGKPIPQEINNILWEGVCVLAAHAFLKSHQQSGFLEAEFDDPEEKIWHFSRLGQVVLARYFTKQSMK